jgi:hypothetical protein
VLLALLLLIPSAQFSVLPLVVPLAEVTIDGLELHLICIALVALPTYTQVTNDGLEALRDLRGLEDLNLDSGVWLLVV